MVVLEYDTRYIQKLTKLSKDRIIDGLTEIGAPTTEENGKLICELTPNRPDWFSAEGISRALNAYYDGKIKKYKVRKKSGYRLIVENVPFRPCAAWAIVKNLKFDDQKIKDIIQLQEKLDTTLGRKVKKFGIGFYPLKDIEFPITYKLMDPKKIVYRPLNYPKEANAIEILEKHQKGKEYGHLLEGRGEYPVYIDAKKRIMCLVPIVNSAETGKVDETTTEILIEVTGTEFESVNAALNIICCSLIDAGGEVYSIEIDDGKRKFNLPDLKTRKIKLDRQFTNKLLGIQLNIGQIKKFLRMMGYEIGSGYVVVPPYRADIMHFVDIVEDVAIAYGFNKFVPSLPNFFSGGRHSEDKYLLILETMLNMGFIEAKTFVLTNKNELKKINYGRPVMEIENPSGTEYTLVRPTLLASMLDVLAINKTRGLPQKIFEIGLVNEGGKTRKRLCFAVADNSLEFSIIRSYLQTLLKGLDGKYELKKAKHAAFDSEICGGVIYDGKTIGVVGKIAWDAKEKYGLKTDVYACELEF